MRDLCIVFYTCALDIYLFKKALEFEVAHLQIYNDYCIIINLALQ